MRFLIIVTGFNCKRFVAPCIQSIKAQTYSNYRIITVDDGSTDGTTPELLKWSRYCYDQVFYTENLGAAHGRHNAIHKYAADDDIVLLLGMDDELKRDALETIAEQYHNGKWMTYGNWINQNGDGLPYDFPLYFDDETHASRDYRKVKYRSTAPNTFYAKLFKKIPEVDFKLNGMWLDTTTESETMFSCLEMCGKDRIGVIEKPIYIYNMNLPSGTQRRLGQQYKNDVYAQIISRPKKLPYESY